jgi:hypothetical protein
MGEGQRAARIPSADEQDSVVGKPQQLVQHGSRLASEMGQGAAHGHPQRSGKDPIPASRVAQLKQGKRMIRRFRWPGSD